MLQCSYTIPPGCGNLSDSGERSSKPPDIPPLLQVDNYNDEDGADDGGDDDRMLMVMVMVMVAMMMMVMMIMMAVR